jgi:predicted metal-dependent HD superfamily phosphohydrolase
MTMGDDTKTGTDLTDGQIDYIAGYTDETVGPGVIGLEHTVAMAKEIQRRRAANRDLDAVKAGMMADIEATPEIKTALATEIATYRLLASMGVRELRWDDAAVGGLYEKISPAAREVYDRYIAACAAEAAFNTGEGILLRGRTGLTSKALIGQHRLECEVARKRGEAALEYERIVLPEIVALIETKERAFAGARTVEDKIANAPTGRHA